MSENSQDTNSEQSTQSSIENTFNEPIIEKQTPTMSSSTDCPDTLVSKPVETYDCVISKTEHETTIRPHVQPVSINVQHVSTSVQPASINVQPTLTTNQPVSINVQPTSTSVQSTSTNVVSKEIDQEIGSDSESFCDNFASLSYMDVQINLRLLSDVKEGEKLMVIDGKCITVDQRYIQSFRRYWTADSRERTLRFINHLIDTAKQYCNNAVLKIKSEENRQINLEKLINIQSLLRSASTGLGRMATTYAEDKRNLATIETYKSTITVFCDQDLKRTM